MMAPLIFHNTRQNDSKKFRKKSNLHYESSITSGVGVSNFSVLVNAKYVKTGLVMYTGHF
jgi:hypothetical protein